MNTNNKTNNIYNNNNNTYNNNNNTFSGLMKRNGLYGKQTCGI